jgi:hypothetical protein
MWVSSRGNVPSCQAPQAATSRGPGVSNVYPLREAPGRVWPEAWVSAPGRQERRDGQTSGEIPSASANHRVEKWWHGSLPRLVIFRLVAHPLQSKVVGSYPVRGVWFSAVCHWRKPIISKILSHNRRPMIPGVLYPNKKWPGDSHF